MGSASSSHSRWLTSSCSSRLFVFTCSREAANSTDIFGDTGKPALLLGRWPFRSGVAIGPSGLDLSWFQGYSRSRVRRSTACRGVVPADSQFQVRTNRGTQPVHSRSASLRAAGRIRGVGACRCIAGSIPRSFRWESRRGSRDSGLVARGRFGWIRSSSRARLRFYRVSPLRSLVRLPRTKPETTVR